MNKDDRQAPTIPQARRDDLSGHPVDVVQRDLEDADNHTKAVDEAITPSSTRTKEQDAEALQRKVDEIERKVADGN